MDAIIVCGMPAVGKTTVAKIVAEELGQKIVGGGDILKEIAKEHGYRATGEDWWDTAEGMQFLKTREGSNFDKEVDERLLERVETGDVVITSYTLPWLSKKGTKVWLSGTQLSRAGRMSTRDGTSLEACMAIISKRDAENFKLYNSLYGIEFGRDLSPFHLIVGTDGVSAPKVALQVLDYIAALGL